jgi:quercetin dioxygenase-like cupin family protein
MSIYNWFFSEKNNADSLYFDQVFDMCIGEWIENENTRILGRVVNKDVLSIVAEIEKGGSFRAHKHPDGYEEIIVLEGSVEINSGRVLTVGDIEKNPSGYIHCLKNSSNDIVRLLVIIKRKL